MNNKLTANRGQSTDKTVKDQAFEVSLSGGEPSNLSV